MFGYPWWNPAFSGMIAAPDDLQRMAAAQQNALYAQQAVMNAGMHDMLGMGLRNTFAVEREREAGAELQSGIALGRLPDWPAWSKLMAEVPL